MLHLFLLAMIKMLLIWASISGALVSSAAVLFLAPGWELEVSLMRERAFVLFISALMIGWPAGLFAKWQKWSPTTSFRMGMGLGFFPSSAVLGLVLTIHAVVSEKRPTIPCFMPQRAFRFLGPVAHVLPVLVLIVWPKDVGSIPRLEEPTIPAASASHALGSGPDVVLVVIDTLRADVVLDESIPTPHLDEMRKRGVWADYAVASSNQTLPSHLSLLCGLDIEKVGMRGNPSPWPKHDQLVSTSGMQTIASRFQQAGWRTASVASNTLLSRVDESKGYQDFADGFEVWNGMERVPVWVSFISWMQQYSWLGWLTPKALNLQRVSAFPLAKLLDPVESRGHRFHWDEGEYTTLACERYIAELSQGEHPYFLLAQYLDPHTPYLPTAAQADQMTKGLPIPDGFSSHVGAEHVLRERMRAWVEEGGGFASKEEALEARDWLLALYRAELIGVDAHMGRLMDAIEATGRPTIVCFTADHGEAFLDHGNVDHGTTVHAEEVHIPFILFGEGVPNSGRMESRVELVDAGYTLLSLSGLPTTNVDGQNVLHSYEPRPALAVMIRKMSVDDGRWKLIASVDYGDSPEVDEYELLAEALYDLQSDPTEQTDVLTTYPNVAKRLELALKARLKKDLLPDLEERALSRAEKAQLNALGYADTEDEE